MNCQFCEDYEWSKKHRPKTGGELYTKYYVCLYERTLRKGCGLASTYTLSWALASLRDKLKHYEDARIPEIMPEGLQTIDRAIGTYGKDAQLTKAVEEMSELTKALCKLKVCKLKYDTPFNRETQEVYSNIEEETADVFIMLVQLFVIFNPHELVNITKIVWDKLDRLKDNLDKEAAKQEASDAGKK